MKIFLISRARSGTNLLRRLISSSKEIHCFSEILNADFKNSYFKFLKKKVTENIRFIKPQYSEELFKEYIDELHNSSPLEKSLFDLKIENLDALPQQWKPTLEPELAIRFIAQNKHPVIFLERQNHIKRLLSNANAVKSKIYHNNQEDSLSTQSPTPIGTERLLEKLESFDATSERLSSYLKNRTKVLFLSYEELITNGTFNQNVVEKINDAFQCNIDPETTPGLKKLQKLPLDQSISNFDEISRILKGSKYEHLLLS